MSHEILKDSLDYPKKQTKMEEKDVIYEVYSFESNEWVECDKNEFDRTKDQYRRIIKLFGWNKVSEDSYPPFNKGVLVFIPDEDYHITSGMWDISKKWVLLDEYRKLDCEVTHWMECPDVPNEYKKEVEENAQVMKALKYLLKPELTPKAGNEK